jgi:hypothetical protein
MAHGDDDMLSEAVESLRTRLPGRPESELRAIAEEELVRVRVRALVDRSAGRFPRCGEREE